MYYKLIKIEELKKENYRITLLYAAKDKDRNNTVVLTDHIEG